jgi:hypothetical protein
MFDVSVIVLLVSIGAIVDVSTEVESVVLELEPLLHAAIAPIAPIAKTINNFFICLCFLFM